MYYVTRKTPGVNSFPRETKHRNYLDTPLSLLSKLITLEKYLFSNHRDERNLSIDGGAYRIFVMLKMKNLFYVNT